MVEFENDLAMGVLVASTAFDALPQALDAGFRNKLKIQHSSSLLKLGVFPYNVGTNAVD